MKQDQKAAFPDTQAQADAVAAVEPVHAGWLTRAVYCLALLALLLASLAQASSWVGMATGRGLILWAGPTVFLLVAAALVYRIYRVLRDRSALDARPANAFGVLLRGLGWLLMLAGATGAASLLLVKPLALLIFHGGGEAGIAFFVVGLYATLLASVGWIGCLLFEISRPLGKRITLPAPPRARRQRRQDAAVFAALVLLALALPWLSQLAWGEGCLGKTLGACMAKVEGGVTRLALAPLRAPVALESNLDAIEYRHSAGRNWRAAEVPAVSLLKSGHPVAPPGAGADVRVTIKAAESEGGVLVTLLVTEKGQETASFRTRFKSRARLEPAADGKRTLVVELPRNVERLVGAGRDEILDEIYRQVRTAIGSEREVAEASVQVKRQSKIMASTALAERPKMEDARPASSCDGILKFQRVDAEADVGQNPGGFLPHLVFVQQPAPAPSVLIYPGERVGCHGGAVWTAAHIPYEERHLRIRRYDMTGALQRNVLVEVPARKPDEWRDVEEASFVERDGRIEFDVIVHDIVRQKARRERFGVVL